MHPAAKQTLYLSGFGQISMRTQLTPANPVSPQHSVLDSLVADSFSWLAVQANAHDHDPPLCVKEFSLGTLPKGPGYKVVLSQAMDHLEGNLVGKRLSDCKAVVMLLQNHHWEKATYECPAALA